MDKRLSQDDYLLKLGERAVELKQEQFKDEVGEKSTLEKELIQIARDIESAFKMFGTDNSSDKIIQMCRIRLEKLEDEKQKAISRIRELEYKIEKGTSAANEMMLVPHSLELFQKAKKSGSRKMLKRILRKVFLNIRVEAGRLGLSYWTTTDFDWVGLAPQIKKASDNSSEAVLNCHQNHFRPEGFPVTTASWVEAVDFMQFKLNGRVGGIHSSHPGRNPPGKPSVCAIWPSWPNCRTSRGTGAVLCELLREFSSPPTRQC